MHNRDRERAQLKRKLEAGVSIHMPAPRRIGKTWTINRLAEDLRGAGWLAIEIDVEGMSTPREFARDLCLRIEAQNSIRDRFKTHAIQRLNNLLGGAWGDKPIDALGSVDPIEFAETLIGSLHESGDKTAIIVDEVSYFFLALAERDQQEAHAFAYKLRALQQRYRKVRWVITGSIGLDTIARRYGLEGAFVDFDTFELHPFTTDEARSFMRDPAIQQQFNHVFDAGDGDFDWMFGQLGWLAPYYLMLVANEVRPSIPGEGTQRATATRADFEAAFEKLLQPTRKAAFAVWREHISKNLPVGDRLIAKHILDALSADASGETEETLLARASLSEGNASKRQIRDILAMLTSDGLIEKAEQRYGFRSGLIRRYWQTYEED